MQRAGPRVDYLIAGQGLAGSLLAWILLQRGRSVLLVDRRQAQASSRAAAGLVNPVSGRRMVKMPHTEGYLKSAQRTYQVLAEELGRRFFFPKPMLRLPRSAGERQRCIARRRDPAYRGYLGPPDAEQTAAPGIHAPFGVFLQQHTGYLDIPPLLDLLWDLLRQRGAWRDGWIDPAKLQMSGDGLVWQGLRANRVVFCEGFRAAGNRWFSWLPFQPVKGEILTLLGPPDALGDRIINVGRWLFPLGRGTYRLGSTYHWGVIDDQPSVNGREELLRCLPGFLRPLPEFRVIDQCAGVRPATLDKRPFIGCHPGEPRVCICNGFGSKGALLIPYYATRLADHLCSGRPLPADADILRFAERAP